jgi:hypothetical protein
MAQPVQWVLKVPLEQMVLMEQMELMELMEMMVQLAQPDLRVQQVRMEASFL